ncbi:sodium- and chloride-dependent taurine transporter-like [Planococcus citri]|uniref:sodium- and chloride-dependent taurine transporter-like n=1 Tax=Planococcus citri TaxID=170843 RepID=UPI0031F9A708
MTEKSENIDIGLKTDNDGKSYVREKWAHKIEFVLSGIGFAVGLGNVWRFPYLCYKNGGGAFLIPFFVCLVTGGIPIFLLEIGLGQLTSEGGITAWNICPVFKGIGYATTIVCFLLNVYYIVILAWAGHYFYNSFNSVLPWSTCDNWWNTKNCFVPKIQLRESFVAGNSSIRRVDSVVEYWERRVLRISSGVDEPGGLQWELALSLLIVWILIYFCVWKGIKTSGKVVYFTAVFPYVMLTVLFFRGITLDGALDGIKFYLKPDFSKITEPQVWIDAGTQIFFSYAIALGCMIALGSYNKFNNNFVKDCFIIAATNTSTSLYAGFAIFSVLGYMAKEQGVPIAQVAESGPGLVFIAYPKAVTQMPWSPVWSMSFFMMILLIGVDSQFVGVEGFITAVVDIFPNYFRVGKRKEKFIAYVCFFSYLIGLLMVTEGGMYVFQIFDFYAASGMVLLCICFFESICIAYFYGVDKFYDDITRMVGYRLMPWFKYCWMYFTPVITLGIMMFSISSSLTLTYNRVYRYPNWAMAIGWTMALIPIICIPIYFVYYLFTRPGNNINEKWKKATESLIPEKHNDVPIS